MDKICLEHLIMLDSKDVTKYYYQKEFGANLKRPPLDNIKDNLSITDV